MRSLSPMLASLASAFKPPISQSASRPSIPILNHAAPSSILGLGSLPSTRPFSATASLGKKKEKVKPDKRVSTYPTHPVQSPQATQLTKPALIRYFLHHPKTPRPLRFSRNRYLRHWTIHRAWHLYQARRRQAHENELQRQWQAMNAACEELRVGAGDGGKLFRQSMHKKGVFTDLVPIEYGRLQTEWPSTEGWDHEWKRPVQK